LHGIWSGQQTIYTEDEEKFAWTCGPNEVLVGQTVDTVQVQQTCTEDGFGCSPHLRMCDYTIINTTDGRNVSLNVPCHLLCLAVQYVCTDSNRTEQRSPTTGEFRWSLSAESDCTTNYNTWTDATTSYCLSNPGTITEQVMLIEDIDYETGEPVGEPRPVTQEECEEAENTWYPVVSATCVTTAPWLDGGAGRDITTAVGNTKGGCMTSGVNVWTSDEQYVLCAGGFANDDSSENANLTTPWAQSESSQYWPGNDWDWRSQKFLGDYTNAYYATERLVEELDSSLRSRSVAENEFRKEGSDFDGGAPYRESQNDDEQGDGSHRDICFTGHAVRR
jgi:hypothetical protein